MGIEINKLNSADIEVKIVGKMDDQDFQEVDNQMEQLLANPTVRIGMILDVSKATGWTPAGFWEEIKFDAKHYNNIEKLAVVSDRSKDELVATLSKPFTGADVEFFKKDDLSSARKWISQ